MSKKDTRVPANDLNPLLPALLVDLRYSISIFVCRLVVTENISGEGAIALFAPLDTSLTDSDVAYHNANLRISVNVRKLFSGVLIFVFTSRILATAEIYEKNVEGF